MQSPDGYKRFTKPSEGDQYPSEYDLSSDNLQDQNSRDLSPFKTLTLDLSVAGTFSGKFPGRALAPYYFQTNTPNKVRASSGFASLYLNADAPDPSVDAFPLAYDRGYNGSYYKFCLSWTAQANTSLDLVILRSNRTPWMTDDAPVTSGGGGGSFTANTTNVTANYTGVSTDNFVSADATAGDITITLPPPSNGQIFGVVKEDSSANTVSVTGTINGGGPGVVLNFQNDAITYWSNATTWFPYA